MGINLSIRGDKILRGSKAGVFISRHIPEQLLLMFARTTSFNSQIERYGQIDRLDRRCYRLSLLNHSHYAALPKPALQQDTIQYDLDMRMHSPNIV